MYGACLTEINLLLYT